MIKIDHLDVVRDHGFSLNNIDLIIPDGKMYGLVGPNGSGKSTLIETVCNKIHPDSGKISIDGKNISEYKIKELAKTISVMFQKSEISDFEIEDVVLAGRTPYKNIFEQFNSEDEEKAISAIHLVNMDDYLGRRLSSLSGGEQQRIFLARCLTQSSSHIIMDEPTNHLDIKHQLDILNIVKKSKLTILCAIHDLNLAALFCDAIAVMNKGKIVAVGTPEEVLTPSLILDVFGVVATVKINELTGKVNVTYIPDNI